MLVLFVVDVVKSFFAAKQDVVRINGVDVFKAGDKFIGQLGKVDHLRTFRGQVQDTDLFFKDKLDITLRIFF